VENKNLNMCNKSIQQIQSVTVVENKNLDTCNKSNAASDTEGTGETSNLLKQANDNNKTIEGYITTLLPAILALINKEIYNAVIYFYIYLVSDYFLNFLFNIFLRKIEDTNKIRNFFDLLIRIISFGKYIFILYLLIISLK